ncbi:MAG: hypothetical protein HYV63_26925 [Candidatus Schekmanbacteria bacterium]|nr:hypothetical protein [Candidatus Schekmanbacteria bacterium]
MSRVAAHPLPDKLSLPSVPSLAPRSAVTLLAVLVLAGMCTSGCSLRRYAIKRAMPIVEEAMPALEGERDLDFARDALAGNIKILEAVHLAEPTNQRLRVLLARAYGSYALAFPQDEAERWELEDPARSDLARARARDFYQRCKGYATTVVAERNPEIVAALEGRAAAAEGRVAALTRALAKASKDDVPALFWMAYGWGNLVNLSRDNIAVVSEAPLVVTIMERLVELDERYFMGGAHLFFAAWYGGLPKALGGKPDLAEQHFKRAEEINEGKLMLIPIYRARFLAVQAQDRELFESELRKVLASKDDILPGQDLVTALSKHKARWLLQMADDLF